MANHVCMYLFASQLRPDPKDDFADDLANRLVRDAETQSVGELCDVRKLMGVVDMNGKEVN